MKTKYLIKIFFFLIASFTPIQIFFPQGDINEIFNKASIDQALQVLVDSKAINFAQYDGTNYGVSDYVVNITSANIRLIPDNLNNIEIDITFMAKAKFNAILFDFDIPTPTSPPPHLTLIGHVTLIPQGQGYKLNFVTTDYKNFSVFNSWLDLLIEDKISGFIKKIPDISFASFTSLLPGISGQFFTSSIPTLTVTSDAIELSLNIINGPRFITAYNEVNDVNQNTAIGNVQVEEGTNIFISYPSPKTFTFNSGTAQKLQTPLPVLETSNGYNKYRNWIKKFNNSIPNDIAPRRIQINVGSYDETYSAKFDPANHIQLSNSLEGSLTGGTVT